MKNEPTFGECAEYISGRLKEIDDVKNKVVFDIPDGKGKVPPIFILHRTAITEEEFVETCRKLEIVLDE